MAGWNSSHYFLTATFLLRIMIYRFYWLWSVVKASMTITLVVMSARSRSINWIVFCDRWNKCYIFQTFNYLFIQMLTSVVVQLKFVEIVYNSFLFIVISTIDDHRTSRSHFFSLIFNFFSLSKLSELRFMKVMSQWTCRPDWSVFYYVEFSLIQHH